MNRQAMAALRARLQAKIAQSKPLTTSESSQHSNEENEPMNNTAVLDEVEEETEEQSNDALTTQIEELPEVSDEPEEDTEEAATAVLAAPSVKSRPRRKRHYVAVSADGKCEILLLDLKVPGVVEDIQRKFTLIPGSFRTRTVAEWYVANASNLPSVKTARDAEKLFKMEAALVQG